MKQHCYSNQFIAINDNMTSNPPSIESKWTQGKHNREQSKQGRNRDREKGLRRERRDVGGKREVAWVDFDRWLKSTPEYF